MATEDEGAGAGERGVTLTIDPTRRAGAKLEFKSHPRLPCYTCDHWKESHTLSGPCAHPGCECEGWKKTYDYKLMDDRVYEKINAAEGTLDKWDACFQIVEEKNK